MLALLYSRIAPYKTVLRYLFSALFVVQGLNHFISLNFFARIIPPFLPYPDALVILSGIAEIALGILLQFARFRALAAWGLILLLIAVFPANIYMALNADLFPPFPAWLLWLRLPFQAVFIAWAYWYTLSDPIPATSQAHS